MRTMQANPQNFCRLRLTPDSFLTQRQTSPTPRGSCRESVQPTLTEVSHPVDPPAATWLIGINDDLRTQDG